MNNKKIEEQLEEIKTMLTAIGITVGIIVGLELYHYITSLIGN